ncbi:hypothetical protein [Streptomyces cinereoruber]|uniref:hypothetical protein n=1 Tax=Streptomyces cinereoruber TaxID=67260 RepID=UPI00362EB96A
MTLNAMDWVWNHARAKGNPRLVLLAVADKVTDAQCITRMGTTEFRARLGNVSKSVVVRAVDQAIESGELIMVEGPRGTLAAKYQLPYAVGYVRPTPGSRGTDSGPVAPAQGSQIGTPSKEQGSQIETGSEDARGTDSGPEGYRIETPRGTDSGPLHQSTPTRSASQPEDEPDPAAATTIPDFARPLIDTISRAGYDTLRWNLKHPEWLIIHALINSHGADRLARYAIEQCQQRQISYGKYFLPGWRDLPPTPEPGSGRPQLRAVAGGWQPYQNPVDPSVYENGF